jgi:hypothetical protein
MLRTDFMPTQVKQIGHSGMGNQNSLRLPRRFELSECRTTHHSLPHPSRLMGLLYPVVRISISEDNSENLCLLYTSVAFQFRHKLPK